jgi:hypothetical protein
MYMYEGEAKLTFIDLLKYNKLYILCATENAEVFIYVWLALNTYETITKGFCKREKKKTHNK